MHTGLLLFILVVLLLVLLSIRERVRLMNMRDKNWDSIGEAQSSPLSRALTGLVGTAGGIYLSLVLLQTFLEMDVPENIYLGGIALEPLAAVSITLAIVQPFATRFFVLTRKRRF